MLPAKLERIRVDIEDYARSFGLDFFPVLFEILDYKQVSEVAAYGGFPTRYPHWRFGMEYDRLDKGYTYGMQRIYEMVINNDPCYAYLLASNPIFDQKTVMAHVYGHADFFKCNAWFSKTNRKMMDEMANHGARIRAYADRLGFDPVEEFLDTALSLENLIDPYSPFIRRDPRPVSEEDRKDAAKAHRLPAKKYMENFINPKETLNREIERQQAEQREREERFPNEPVRDVLSFLIDHAPIPEWQQDLLSIVREEAYYFAPQWMTKIMNEGWATFWHSRIMTRKALKDSELIDYADHYAGVTATPKGGFNPYKIGVELWRDIEDRWNRGRFGREYHECENMSEKLSWDKPLGLGLSKIFEVRRVYNDVTFIDEFLTPEFCEEHKLFTYGYSKRTERWEIVSREYEAIKQQLLQSLTNAGHPVIEVLDANFGNRGELLLRHRFDKVPLDLHFAQETLKNLHKIWRRPVGVLSVSNEKKVILRFDGETHTTLDA